ncbi:hypothetical protein [Aerococcus kribbianus]|uniref:Uncharacterized protein n=1 Tax=Aerococcus kribbianus TaxID=2999064 RepID=A0A9X3FS31_9LACT|nr:MULTISPECIES: hypothetical protein [unclassified Aerococcus]MCZ0717377.1 hypothetical protein [Aerococcus sp. YH-aer221]MCZ0725665.1 hypothetical protein [Aerococcus sp. YH-aer222]
MSEKTNYQTASDNFYSSVHRLGGTTSVIALIAMFTVPIGTALAFGIEINFWESFVTALSLIAIFLPTAVAENLSFYPVLGAGGMYLASITGNILNMKLPVVVSSQKIAGVEPGTEKGDIMSIIAIGISSLTTIVILILGNFLIGTWLIPILESDALKPGFDNIIPALMGALTIPQIVRNFRKSIFPVCFALILFLILGPEKWPNFQSYILILNMGITVGLAYWKYKRSHNRQYK